MAEPRPTCISCRRLLKDAERVINILQVVGNEKRGDFVSGTSNYVHLQCLIRYAGGLP